jgi:hypothetical protein
LIGGDVVGVISLKKVAVRATATTAAAGSADIVVCVGFGGDQARPSTADPSRASFGSEMHPRDRWYDYDHGRDVYPRWHERLDRSSAYEELAVENSMLELISEAGSYVHFDEEFDDKIIVIQRLICGWLVRKKHSI